MAKKQENKNIIPIDDFILLIASEPLESQALLLERVKKNPDSLETLHKYLSYLLENLAKMPIEKPNYSLCNQIFILFHALAYLKEEKTFSSILSLTKLDKDFLNEIYFDEDFLYENFPYLLCSYTLNNWERLKKIIEDPSTDIIWKIITLYTLPFIAALKRSTRKPIIAYLKSLLQPILNAYDNQNLLTRPIITTLDFLYPLESMEEIREAYGKFIVDDDDFSIDDILETLQKTQKDHFRELEKEFPTQEDLLNDLRILEDDNEVNAPDDEDIKIPPRNCFSSVERNDPCPCGSNKKFKKCCETKRSDPQLLLPYLPIISFETTSDSIDDIEQKDAEMILKVMNENAPGENSSVVLPILFKLKEKYPHIPIFYHLIDSNYICNDKIKESLEMLSIGFKKFPDNILWKLKYAEYLLRRGEYDKIEKLFQGNFTLQELYPEKSSFYIEDFENFSRFIILYFAKIGQIEKADLYLSAMKEFVSQKDLIEDLDRFIETCYQRQYLKKQQDLSKCLQRSDK